LRLNETACQSTCEHPLAGCDEAAVALAGKGINKSVVDFVQPAGDDAIERVQKWSVKLLLCQASCCRY
jgi:hypothetical protein